MRRAPLRGSLLLRLLAASVLIAACSVAATAWLAVQSTTTAIQHAQGQALTDDAQIYDTLLGYAAVHPSWDGADAIVKDLARSTGRQIFLTTEARQPLATSANAPRALPAKASAVIDPLHTDPTLHPGTADRIDPRAVGPYQLTAREQEDSRRLADKVQLCLRRSGYSARVTTSPGGSHNLDVTEGPPLYKLIAGDVCEIQDLSISSATELRAVHQLNVLVDGCLRQRGLPGVTLQQPASADLTDAGPLDDSPVQTCLRDGRRQQLTPYVAPSALLFVLSPGGAAPSRFDLSRANITRIIGVTALVFAVTIAVTALVATRLVRPLRALTAAARHPDGAFDRVPVRSKDEIGVLATALIRLTERREQAEAQRKAMVSDIAHELRTPLTNIRSWLEATEDGLAGPVSDPALTRTLLKETRQLQHIIDDLQDLAVADAGGLPLHLETVAVSDLLRHVTAAHSGSAEAVGVTLHTSGTEDTLLAADPRRLRQAVGNLVSNALRYTPPGGRITLSGRIADDGQVEIAVADTGTGISADDLPHVFDRFWRADPSRSRETGGSGLGLAIVRQITEAHGGTVAVTSPPGLGATFTLRFAPATAAARTDRGPARAGGV